MAVAGNLRVIGCMGVLSPAGQELWVVGDRLGCCSPGVHTRESDERLRLRGSGRHRGILSRQPASSGSCPCRHRALQGKRPRSLSKGGRRRWHRQAGPPWNPLAAKTTATFVVCTDLKNSREELGAEDTLETQPAELRQAVR